jgi:transposase
MKEVTIVGIDLAKRVFQLHGAAADGAVVFRKKLSRAQLLPFLAAQPACIVAMEACATAHHWGRQIGRLGHEVRLIPPAYVKPFVKRQKNDTADAEAIAEAAARPTMRFVTVKTEAQQARATTFRARDLLVRQRTQLSNALRGHLAEYGIVAAQGMVQLKRLRTGKIKEGWLARMLARKPRLVVAIALANKMARSIWAMLVKQEDYRDPAAAPA